MFEDFDLDEMAGANMNARDVHQHLKKRGWSLTRTSGGHDVYTHPKSEKHIAVPRHKQLKAPLVLGIMKTAKTVSESEVKKNEFWNKTSWIKKMSHAAKQERLAREKKEAENKQVKEQYRDEGRFEPVKPHEVKSTAVVTPRKKSDSANVKLREEETLDEAVYSIKNTKTGQIYFHSKYPINKDNERLKKIQSAGGDHVHATPHKDGKPMNEDIEQLDEKNVPTSPEKWAQAKAQAKAKFDVYPSAYANGWAAKKYKAMGGGWKSVSEESEVNEDLRKWFDPKHPEGGWKRINSKGEAVGPCAREPGEAKPKCMSNEKRASLTKKERASAVAAKRKHDPNPERKGEPINVSNYGKGKISEQVANAPFDPPYSKKTGTHTDKSGAKHGPMSTAKHLAKMAAAKQVRELSKKTDPSRKGEIVKETMKDAKKKGEKKDQYNADPVLNSQIIRTE